MRVVVPGPLLRRTAELLAPIRDDAVLIGGLAVQIALDGKDVALTESAFGRERPGGERVDRDFSDAVLLLDRQRSQIAEEAAGQMRARVARAAERLRDEDEAVAAAARELVAMGEVGSVREGEAAARRAGREMLAEMGIVDRG